MHAIQFEEWLQPETILPVQFDHMWCVPYAVSPERALLVAVLQQAIDDLRDHQESHGATARRLYREAYQWVASDDRSWPCSFLNICDLLHLSAGALRAALLASGRAAAA